MDFPRIILVVAFQAVTLTGCGDDFEPPGPEDNPTTLRDTLGLEVSWSCEAEGCEPEMTSDTPTYADCAEREVGAFSVYDVELYERIALLSERCVGAPASQYWSRPVACDVDEDCPVVHWTSPDRFYECVNGLCQSTDTERYPRDDRYSREVFNALCLANVPRTETVSNSPPMPLDAYLDTFCPDDLDRNCLGLPQDCYQP